MKYMIRFLTLWVSFIALPQFALTVHGQIVHIAHCMADCPSGAPTNNEIVVHQLYAASVNSDSGLADWVAYRILGESVGVASLLPRQWKQDQLLPDNAGMEPGDSQGRRLTQEAVISQSDRSYRINEYIFDPDDRGRLAPMTSFASTPYWEELNNMTNMAPIPSELRTGSWARLEQAVNEFAETEGELYVISGPLYEISEPFSLRTTGFGGQPSAYFKVVATLERHAAFIFSSELGLNARYCAQQNTLQRIEQLSGLKLFPGLLLANNRDLAPALRCPEN